MADRYPLTDRSLQHQTILRHCSIAARLHLIAIIFRTGKEKGEVRDIGTVLRGSWW
jgi:hypothetical protein